MAVFPFSVLPYVSSYVTTTTPPVIVVCSRALTTPSTFMMAVTTVGLSATQDQQDVVLPPPLILRDTIRGVVNLITVPQQHTQSKIFSQAYASYAMIPSQVSFLLKHCAIYWFPHVGVCYSVCFLLSDCSVAAMFTSGGSTIGVYTTATCWNVSMAGLCDPWCWSVAHTRTALSSCSLYCLE